MRNTIIIALISLLMAGCGKDKFSSTPQLKFKSFNRTEVANGQNLVITLSFTDAEGDLQDSIYVERYATSCNTLAFKTYYTLPVFPAVKNSEGDIIISYTNGSGGQFPPMPGSVCNGNPETCYFRFVLQDEAKHKSDTLTTGLITITQ